MGRVDNGEQEGEGGNRVNKALNDKGKNKIKLIR